MQKRLLLTVASFVFLLNIGLTAFFNDSFKEAKEERCATFSAALVYVKSLIKEIEKSKKNGATLALTLYYESDESKDYLSYTKDNVTTVCLTAGNDFGVWKALRFSEVFNQGRIFPEIIEQDKVKLVDINQGVVYIRGNDFIKSLFQEVADKIIDTQLRTNCPQK